MWRILYALFAMSCCGCSGNITQILRSTGLDCCPTLDLANGTATLVDADGNVLNIGPTFTLDTVTLTLAGDMLTVGVNGMTATAQLMGIPDVVTSLIYNDATGILTYNDEDGSATNIDLTALANMVETLTSLTYDAALMQLTYTPENGNPQLLDLSGLTNETLTTLALQGDTLNYTDEDGTLTPIDLSGFRETETTLNFDPATSTLTYTPESGAAIPLDLSPLEHVTTLAYDVATQRLTYTNESNVATIADLSGLNVLTTLNFDAANSILSYRAEDGNVTNVDLSGFSETITTIAFAPATSTLTYTPEDGNAIALDLSPLIPVASANSPTIALNGDGSALAPLVADAIISPQAGNILQAIADGLFVAETVTAIAYDAANFTLNFTDEAGAVTALDLSNLIPVDIQDSPTVALTGDGTAATPLQADAIISAQAGNIVQALADGLFAAAPMVNAALDLVGTDLNLRIDGNIVSTVDLRTAATVILTDNLGNQIGRALPI